MSNGDSRATTTRRSLERTARQLFETKGVSAVSAEEIVAAAGLTRGALYHHYGGKEGLFEAVAEIAMADLHQAIAAKAADSQNPVDALKKGIQAFLTLSEVGATRRLLFVDAPMVLGWGRWRELDAQYGLGMLERAIDTAVRAKLFRPQSAHISAHLLLSAMIEGAMMIAADPSKSLSVRKHVESALLRIIESLK